MIDTATEPIGQHWTPEGLEAAVSPPSTAAQANERLARIEVSEVSTRLVPYLAAAAAELALLAGVPWKFSADDPPVALLRMIAKAAMIRPHVGGPHTTRLYEALG